MNRDWRESAACKGLAPQFDSLIEDEPEAVQRTRIAAAVRICNSACPVVAECKADFVKGVDAGVRFGEIHGLPRNAIVGGGNGHISLTEKVRTPDAARREVLDGNPGDHNKLLGSVRREVVMELTAQGLTARQVAERLKVTPRAVTRIRAAARAAEQEAS